MSTTAASNAPARAETTGADGVLVDPGWLEEGNTVVVAPDGSVIAGPVREREQTLVADLDLRTVAVQRRHIDPVGHYNRPDVFRLHVDTSPRPAVIEIPGTAPAAGNGGAAQQRTISESPGG